MRFALSSLRAAVITAVLLAGVAVPAAAASEPGVTGRLVPIQVEGTDGLDYAVETASGDLVDLDRAPSARAVRELARSRDRAAAIAVPAEHRAYVVKVNNRGPYLDAAGAPLADEDGAIAALVDQGLARFTAETSGFVTAFPRVGAVVSAAAPGTTCQAGPAVWNALDDELFPGVSFGLGSGNHLIVVQPRGCGGGVGTVGTGLADGGRVQLDFDPRKNTTTVPHELGHNVGLQHARSYECDPVCEESEYGNLYTAMGGSVIADPIVYPGAFDTFDRTRLGVTAPDEVVSMALPAGTVSVSQDVVLHGRGTDLGTRGVEVVDPADGSRYFFEWRNGLGRDALSAYARTRSGPSAPGWHNTGITVQRVRPDGVSTVLLSSVRARSGWNYALTTGQSFTTPGLTVAVRALSPSLAETESTATITVTVRVPGSAEPPTTTTTPGARRRFAMTARPRLMGKALVGSTLKVSTTDGRWRPDPTTFHYRWLVDGKRVGKDRARLTMKAAYRGARVAVVVRAERPGYRPVSVRPGRKVTVR